MSFEQDDLYEIDAGRMARLKEIEQRDNRRLALEQQFGKPERISNADALAQAAAAGKPEPHLDPDGWWVAYVYPDERSLEGWLASNTEHWGHKGLFRVELPDGRWLGAMVLNMSCPKVTG